MTGTAELRAWALALPEVTETVHGRFGTPKWSVHGRTFLGLGRDETTVVCCLSEEAAGRAVAVDPDHATVVRRQDARRSFLGIEVTLAGVAPDRLRDWVRQAWAAQAPKRLATRYERS
ncbi:MmcQ/YjbR family DNA-binding protein [Actinocatenispora sera]|uniref:MmcQ/YjbR family DNA-binding protein n=1 Tax=Actinocatenispora sera TaxID=390989 RepID=UPI0033F97245